MTMKFLLSVGYMCCCYVYVRVSWSGSRGLHMFPTCSNFIMEKGFWCYSINVNQGAVVPLNQYAFSTLSWKPLFIIVIIIVVVVINGCSVYHCNKSSRLGEVKLMEDWKRFSQVQVNLGGVFKMFSFLKVIKDTTHFAHPIHCGRKRVTVVRNSKSSFSN